MTASLLAGVTVPAVTPMRAPGVPDVSLGLGYLSGLARAGVRQLMLLGSNGEGPLIPAADAGAFVRAAVAAWADLAPGGTVIAAVSAPGSAEVRQRAAAAAEAGAAALVVAPPSYFHHRDDEIFLHLCAATQPGLPVIVYNVPKYVNALSGPVVRQIVDDPRFVGIKDSSGDLAQLELIVGLAAGRPDFEVSQGDERALVAGLDAGAHGILPGTANLAPRLAVELWEAWRAGDHARAEQLQELTTQLTRIHAVRPGVPTIKTVLAQRGLCPAISAEPLIACTQDQTAAVMELLAPLEEWLIC